MILPIYVIFDTISDSVVVIGTANNDKTFIRQNLPYLAKINPNYLNEYKLYRVGDFVESTLSIVPSEPSEIDWNTYDGSSSFGNSSSKNG